MQDAAEEMVNLVIAWPLEQNLPVQYFCFSQLTGSVTRKRQSKNILAYVLYDHAIYRATSSRKKCLSSQGRDAPCPKSISHGLPYTQTGWLHGIAR